MIAGLAKARCTANGRTTPVISSTAAPVSATTAARTLSQMSAATTAARTNKVRIWSTDIDPASCGIAPKSMSNGKKIRSGEHTSELQSLMRISYAVFCLKKKRQKNKTKVTKIDHTIHQIAQDHTNTRIQSN